MNPYQKLENQLLTIKNNIPFAEYKVEAISGGKIGWHLLHSLLVIKNVLIAIEKSNPQDYKWKFNKNRILVFLSGKIPRGKVKAPTPVNPEEENTNATEINRLLDEVILQLKKTHTLPKNSFFNHRIFGILNKKSTIFFLYLHTKHHLAICQDIKKAFTNL